MRMAPAPLLLDVIECLDNTTIFLAKINAFQGLPDFLLNLVVMGGNFHEN